MESWSRYAAHGTLHSSLWMISCLVRMRKENSRLADRPARYLTRLHARGLCAVSLGGSSGIMRPLRLALGAPLVPRALRRIEEALVLLTRALRTPGPRVSRLPHCAAPSRSATRLPHCAASLALPRRAAPLALRRSAPRAPSRAPAGRTRFRRRSSDAPLTARPLVMLPTAARAADTPHGLAASGGLMLLDRSRCCRWPCCPPPGSQRTTTNTPTDNSHPANAAGHW
jgi:hypothetical protein